MPASRSPEQIRHSIETTREELSFSLNDLRAKVTELTDWRSLLDEHRTEAVAGAAVVGFVLGGGLAATIGLFLRRD